MSKLHLFSLVALCAVLVPTAVTATEGTGACYYLDEDPVSSSNPLFPEGGGSLKAICGDNVTPQDCELLTKGEGTYVDGGSCSSLKVPWDGGCYVEADILSAPVCMLVASDPASASQEFCSSFYQGSWSDDPAACGAPVPAAPKAALALMMLVLLAGSLGVLAFKAPSA